VFKRKGISLLTSEPNIHISDLFGGRMLREKNVNLGQIGLAFNVKSATY
jgi:hypothetical protein